MRNLMDMIWIEARKALRSRMPLGTALGALFLPFALAFLIFVARNAELAQKLGLVGAKANLVAYSATDWPAYLAVTAQIVAVGGFFLDVSDAEPDLRPPQQDVVLLRDDHDIHRGFLPQDAVNVLGVYLHCE